MLALAFVPHHEPDLPREPIAIPARPAPVEMGQEYEFPSLPGPVDRWDDWLLVRVEVSDGARSWTGVHPSLTTWELRDLIRWCRALAEGAPGTNSTFKGTEPNISFVACDTGESIRLTGVLGLESCPPWVKEHQAPLENWSGHPALHATFTLGQAGLRAFAAELETDLGRFPERAA